MEATRTYALDGEIDAVAARLESLLGARLFRHESPMIGPYYDQGDPAVREALLAELRAGRSPVAPSFDPSVTLEENVHPHFGGPMFEGGPLLLTLAGSTTAVSHAEELVLPLGARRVR